MIWIVGTVFLLAAGGLYQLSVRAAGFAEWYRENVYRVLAESITRISGRCPYALAEIAAGALLLFFLIGWIHMFRKGGGFGRFFRWLGALYLAASVLVLLYMLNCGINYRSVPFSGHAGLLRDAEDAGRERADESTGDDRADDRAGELTALCSYIAEHLKEEGDRAAVSYGTEEEIAESGRRAMERLGQDYPVLAGFYPAPKPLITSKFFSAQQVTGIYLPFFLEAGWNRDIPGYNRPFTVCHELSHLRGFMREDEANFIAFLACISSEDPRFVRSGWLEGWVYAGNALAEENPEAFAALYGEIPESLRAELEENNAYWDQFRGTTARVHEKINDTYLKANGQEEGVRTYDRVVELMLAYARRQKWTAKS